MTRKELKARSWEQIGGKIGIYFVISLIMGGIIGAVSSVISLPQQMLSAFMNVVSMIAESQPYITDEEAIAYLLVYLAISASACILSFIQFAVQTLITGPFYFSDANIFLKITNNEPISVGHAFGGFKTYWKSVTVYLWTYLFTTLWSLLFIIPGIVKSYAYALAPYIAIENPELSALECVTRSKNMMNGHKWELFVLDLSFIGWMLLSFVSCGVAVIWYTPYYKAARANFYRKLKEEL